MYIIPFFRSPDCITELSRYFVSCIIHPHTIDTYNTYIIVIMLHARSASALKLTLQRKFVEYSLFSGPCCCVDNVIGETMRGGG